MRSFARWQPERGGRSAANGAPNVSCGLWVESGPENLPWSWSTSDGRAAGKTRNIDMAKTLC